MKNLNLFANGKTSLVLTGLLIISLVFGRFTPVSGQSNNIVITPPVLYVGASADISPVNLSFSQGPVPWVAIPQSTWLQATPQTGVAAGTVQVIRDANTGPARVGYILFLCPTPGGANQFLLKVMQNQGLSPSLLQFEWQQLIYPNIDHGVIPNTASALFDYTPVASALWANIIGRTTPGGPTSWLVRNVYMPAASWSAGVQHLRLPVDLALLGYGITDPVESINYSWSFSLDPEPAKPQYPDAVWNISDVVPLTVAAEGRDNLVPFIPVPFTDFYIDFSFPFSIIDLLYIGCEMTNGDLDGSTHPGDPLGCGPAAATNSLDWLVGVGDWRDAFNQMSSLMRKPGESTADPDFIRAKLDFIEMYDLPISVKYQDDNMEGDIKSSSGNSSAKCHDAAPGDMPTKAWMLSEEADDEDGEVGVTYPGANAGGHWVVLTGSITINGKTVIWFKDDNDQNKAKGNREGTTPIDETAGGMVVPGIGNAKIDIIVSESYDPDYVPVPTEVTTGGYCTSFKRTLPPGASITIKYPENDKRCFNTSVRVLNHGTKKGYELKEVWNFNSGKERTYVNETGEPVTVEFHNDDHYDGSVPRLKAYIPYDVTATKTLDPGGATTDPSNEEAYAGFSIGTDDDSPDEFGDISDPEVDYPFGIGSSFSDFPRRMNPAGCTKINIDYTILALNRYWNDLGLVLGVSSVATPGTLSYSSAATGISGTIPISGPGEYTVDLGGVSAGSVFDLVLQTTGSLDFMFDNVGVPSLVQVSHTLDVKVFLEGAYNPISGLMSTLLNTSPQIIPLAQPYNFAPWSYAGTESVASIPADVVDWVLLELRDAASPAAATSGTMLAGWPRAFFLKSNGSIVDLDGISQPEIGTPTVTNNLYVVIRHRNHLAIMSASGATFSSGVYSYDFTTGLAQAYGGGTGYKMDGSKAVMVAGDIDHDGNVFISDYNSWASGFGSTLGYYDPDLDMDLSVFVSDYNMWAANFGSLLPFTLKSALIKPRYFSCVPK